MHSAQEVRLCAGACPLLIKKVMAVFPALLWLVGRGDGALCPAAHGGGRVPSSKVPYSALDDIIGYLVIWTWNALSVGCSHQINFLNIYFTVSIDTTIEIKKLLLLIKFYKIITSV